MSVPTEEAVILMRNEADKAESLFNKIGDRLMKWEYHIRDLNIEIERAKKDNKNETVNKLDAERESASVVKNTIEKEWNDQLEHHTSLWNKYCEALDVFMANKAQLEKEDSEDDHCSDNDECDYCHGAVGRCGGRCRDRDYYY